MTYSLSADEKLRLQNGLRVALATFFVDGIEDFIWEAIFGYVKDLNLVDPLNETRKKLLFDVVDNKNKIGWSAKTISCSLKTLSEFEVVIQRADIFGKDIGFGALSINSPTDILGSALLRHWKMKVVEDANIQSIDSKRICILLKSKNNKSYVYLEDDLKEFEESDLTWEWTNSEKKGLQGKLKSNDKLIYRWYRSGAQLFERFTIPEEIEKITIEPLRLPTDVVLNYLISTLDNLESSEQN